MLGDGLRMLGAKRTVRQGDGGNTGEGRERSATWLTGKGEKSKARQNVGNINLAIGLVFQSLPLTSNFDLGH